MFILPIEKNRRRMEHADLRPGDWFCEKARKELLRLVSRYKCRRPSSQGLVMRENSDVSFVGHFGLRPSFTAWRGMP